MDRNKYFVYAHYKIGSLDPFYIGKGIGNRETSTHGRNKYWRNIVKKYGYTIKIISKNLEPSDATNIEIFWIDFFGRKDKNKGTLVNCTDGGDGVHGRVIKESDKRYGINNPFYGKSHSKETILKISQSNKKRIWSKESKQKLSKSHLKLTEFGYKRANSIVVLNLENGVFHMSIKEVSDTYNIEYEKARWQLSKKQSKFLNVSKL